MSEQRRISLPYTCENAHSIEKEEGDGQKNRYLYGISSGSKIDGHGEKITDQCIKSFMDQANSGMVLLYPDKHGISASQDIGKLTKAEIRPDGNWSTEYRLHSPTEVGAQKAEVIDTIWKQMNGLPPYDKPLQRGFSIEGYIPDDGIISSYRGEDGALRNRVIDKISLDGVVLVPRPAYQDAMARAIYKALDEMPPDKIAKSKELAHNALCKSIEGKEIKDAYFRKKWDIQDALDESIERIMKNVTPNSKHHLDILFDEYATVMKNMIINSSSLFASKSTGDEVVIKGQDEGNTSSSYPENRIVVFKGLLACLTKLQKLYEVKQ